MHVVRVATVEDIEDMLPMSLALHEHLGLDSMAPYDETFVAGLLSLAVSDDDKLALIARDSSGTALGFLVAFIVPVWFSPTEKMAQEMMYWVEPALRRMGVASDLVATFEEWARDKGITLCALSRSETYEPENVSAFYTSIGYRDATVIAIRGGI
jgi:GNAT superfamily N-acetyltransferase